MTLKQIQDQATKEAIEAALKETGYNTTQAAKQLGVARSYFYEICKRLKIKLEPMPKGKQKKYYNINEKKPEIGSKILYWFGHDNIWLGSKYRFHDKSFVKYWMPQPPPPTEK